METGNACVKKSLTNSLGRLQNKADRLSELERLSERLYDKMLRTEDMPKKEMANIGDKLKSSQPDIIDMFNDVDDRFENLMNRIGNNIDRVIAMID
jgi:hypothetical protein